MNRSLHKNENDMKKRILSLLLCFSLLFGVAVPAMTPSG